MKQKNNWTVLIYVLFLVNLTLIMWVVIFNISWTIFNNNYFYNFQSEFNKNINEKAQNAFKYNKEVNSNGSWYVDNISCPTSVTMSGTTLTDTISTTLTYSSWSIYCSWIYFFTPVYIYFSTGFTDFTGATYGSTVTLTNGVGDTTFSDGDTTLISFSTAWLGWIDGVDDNLNNDDYKGTWTGGAYPSGYEDDDLAAKKTIFWYIEAWKTKNIFWNNNRINDFIANNTNNSGSVLIGSSSWSIYLESDSDFHLKLVKFDRTAFMTNNQLKILDVLETTASGWIAWFIQDDGSVSIGGIIPTGNEYLFDFETSDYALFLSNYSTWTLFFQMNWYTLTWSGIILTPINDSNEAYMTYLWGDILSSDDWLYMYNQHEVTWIK